MGRSKKDLKKEALKMYKKLLDQLTYDELRSQISDLRYDLEALD